MLIHYLPKLLADRGSSIDGFECSGLVAGAVFVDVPSRKMPPKDLSFSVYADVDLEGSEDFVERRHCDFETALEYSKVGKFQWLLLTISGVVYATCAISSTALSFVLPSAGCDFALTSADKGKLTAISLVGMLLGCGVWGSIADSQGRKVAVMLSLLMDFFAAALSSAAQNFDVFLVCRFFNGFGIIGATSIVFPYLGEFLSNGDRDRYLGRLEVFWNFGIIILPGVAWCLLSKNMVDLYAPSVTLSPWRIFVLVCSLPSLISYVLIYYLPETPKYLMDHGKYEKAKMVFQKMYAFNTGRPMETYPVRRLEGEAIHQTTCKMRKKPAGYSLWRSVGNVAERVRALASQQYLKYLAITCFADFGLMASYYTLVLWFPEIFERFNLYETRHPDKTAGICAVSQIRPTRPSRPGQCNFTIGNTVFLETLVIALSCLPTSASLSCFMHKFGKKFVLVFGLILSGLSALALDLVQNSTQTLLVSSVFESLTSVLEAVLLCVVVDLFPTNLRALALSLTVTCGRLGAIFGNVTFGLLLDLNCVVPIYLFGIFLIGSGVLCLAIPRSDGYAPM
ncbi:synaptic vesicle glycoprotein 2C-like [Cylas formicarius]|uniref:synaptic vesicle glycoprotein 2C-like n=1 Tax=Cylas formicarius TaxID=197179 RepID=UPI002958938C|nr:synaptic vesicle glycoprotein 2C-like [Cylas formicarius]